MADKKCEESLLQKKKVKKVKNVKKVAPSTQKPDPQTVANLYKVYGTIDKTMAKPASGREGAKTSLEVL